MGEYQKAEKEICVDCGQKTTDIPRFDYTVEGNRANGFKFPEGGFCCFECEAAMYETAHLEGEEYCPVHGFRASSLNLKGDDGEFVGCFDDCEDAVDYDIKVRQKGITPAQAIDSVLQYLDQEYAHYKESDTDARENHIYLSVARLRRFHEEVLTPFLESDKTLISVGEEEWSLLSNTLEIDAQSAAFDKELREQISAALESVEDFEL